MPRACQDSVSLLGAYTDVNTARVEGPARG